MVYQANIARYDGISMKYRRCGNSGILLPEISLGFWKNFGSVNCYENALAMATTAFDNGVTHFDLANNYGPVFGSAEKTLGRLMKETFKPYRDELFISTKAGYDMWPGPYGNWGSRKYLMASLDQSLKRMGLDYVDLFYIHRFDPETPLQETLQALVDVVKAGKTLYVGISRWPLEALKFAEDYLAQRDVPCLIYQGRLNLLDKSPLKEGILSELQAKNIGFIGFSPLAQGLLTNRYLNGIPSGSRMSREENLKSSVLTSAMKKCLSVLNEVAQERGESLCRMALSWVLHQKGVTSVIVGSSSVEQLKESLQAINSPGFTAEELNILSQICPDKIDKSLFV